MGNRIRDLQSAKHRFASTQLPLGRFVLFFDAILGVAHKIVQTRTYQPEGASAQEFLDFIDEEKLICLALLADAGDEASALVRFFDGDEYDVAASPVMIRSFLNHIDHLFLRRGALTCGYAAHAVQHLRATSRLVRLGSGDHKTIGGTSSVTPEMLNRCFGRMAGYVRLAAESIAAEFPQWKLLSAFGCMDLKPLPSKEFVAESLARLSKCFGWDMAQLAHEFEDFQAFAAQLRARQADSPGANFSCWVESHRRVADRSDRRRLHPCDHLAQLLLRYGAFCGASTSCVERNFAAAMVQRTPTRHRLSTLTMTHELRLAHEVTDATEETVIKHAQAIWASNFGAPRASPGLREKRWVSGRPASAKPKGKMSEKAWIRERRAAASRLSDQAPARSPEKLEAAARAQSDAIWSEKHEKALVALRVMSKRRKLQAHQYGHLLEHEAPEQGEFDTFLEGVKKSNHHEEVRLSRIAKWLDRPAWPSNLKRIFNFV